MQIIQVMQAESLGDRGQTIVNVAEKPRKTERTMGERPCGAFDSDAHQRQRTTPSV